MKKQLVVLFPAACLGIALFACGPVKPPKPPTPPSPSPSPTPVGYDNNRTLRTSVTHLTLLDGSEFHLDMGVQCCDAVPEVANSRWPLQSEEQMAFFQKYGLNAAHFRLGPFYGDADHESEWSDIGGAYLGAPNVSPTLQFNPAFDQKVVALVQYAYDHKIWVEINIIDTWYCKRASSIQGFNDQQMPWPQADIDACGITMTPVQEQFLRHWIKLLGKFPNIIWATDNEGSNIHGTKREWYEAVYNITRNEESVNAYPAHIVGIDNEDFGDGPFEYISTHARAGLYQPIQGKFTLNNERNPEFQPDQEINNFKQARDAGLSYAFWRAGMSNEAVYQTLQGFQAVITNSAPVITGCYAPASEDPLWDSDPASPTGPKDRTQFSPEPGTREAVSQAKAELGPMTGAGHDAMLVALAQKLRDDSWCAAKASDAVMLMSKTNKNVGYEFHAVNYTDDTWSTQDKMNPKIQWTYLGQVAAVENSCPNPLPDRDKLQWKLNASGQWWDATPTQQSACDYCASIGMGTIGGVQRCGCPARNECPDTPGYEGMCQSRVPCEQYLIEAKAPVFTTDGILKIDPNSEWRARQTGGTYLQVCNGPGTKCLRIAQ
jgi:hypothetical protein